jgi:integrase
MSSLRRYAEEYLTIRRALGFKLVGEGYLLASFVTFVEQNGVGIITTELTVTWTRLAIDAGPVYLAKRMRAVRPFARYLHTIDPKNEVPPVDLFPCQKYRPTPHIYTDDEIVALMSAARELAPPLRAATLETIIGLLAATGMRIGEALALDCSDVDWDEGLFTVRNSKYGKSREVLLHPSTVEALKRYANQRDQLTRPWDPSFFVWIRGTRPKYRRVLQAFSELRSRVFAEDTSCQPRIHDLRHTFAVNTLLSWYRDGGDVASRTPLLSTYLGHVDPAATYWYLSAVPELLGLAAQRLELVLEGQS